MIETAIITLVYISYLTFALKRLMTYMHALQQDEYDGGRFFKWVLKHGAFDKRLTLVLLLLSGMEYGASFFTSDYSLGLVFEVLTFFALIIGTYIEKDPRKDSKKALVATKRAQRVFIPTFIIVALAGASVFFIVEPQPWFWIICVQLMLPLLLSVNTFLHPFEDMIQQKFWNEAQAKIKMFSPTVIAITGSFGKTSVKHILGHILKMEAPTLITPGSVNTPMGISRIIREQLNEEHKYFIVEMGAYGRGSIKKLCALTPPDMGIITAIGHAHYERFKSLDTVAAAKFELAEAVLQKGGKIVIHERTLHFPYTRKIKEAHEDHFIVCGDTPAIDRSKQKHATYMKPGDLQIHKIQQMADGLQIQISWRNSAYNFNIPLYGIHHGHNAALAFAMAMELGISPSAIHAAFRSMPQIEHRLEIKKMENGARLVDDAYNSNPLGFRSALDLLAVIKTDGRNILVTPGIVELGMAHDDVHEKIGIYAGEVCDVVVAVNPERIPTFIKGFKSTGASKTLVEVKTFVEASEWMEKNIQPNDIVLIENDLPDIYERIPKM